MMMDESAATTATGAASPVLHDEASSPAVVGGGGGGAALRCEGPARTPPSTRRRRERRRSSSSSVMPRRRRRRRSQRSSALFLLLLRSDLLLVALLLLCCPSWLLRVRGLVVPRGPRRHPLCGLLSDRPYPPFVPRPAASTSSSAAMRSSATPSGEGAVRYCHRRSRKGRALRIPTAAAARTETVLFYADKNDHDHRRHEIGDSDVGDAQEVAAAAAAAQQQQQQQQKRVRRQIQTVSNKTANILSREVRVTDNWTITVWEWEKPAAVVETYWQVENQGLCIDNVSRKGSALGGGGGSNKPMLDPFGLVTWPGSVVAVQEMLRHPGAIRNRSVLLVGAGVGVEAQAAAQLGASRVVATDVHPTTLQLLKYGVEQAEMAQRADNRGNVTRDDVNSDIDGSSSNNNQTDKNTGDVDIAPWNVTTRIFDLCSCDPLPKDCCTMVVADVLYNDKLGRQIVRRCVEAYRRNVTVLISDSQRFCHFFQDELNRKLKVADPNREVVAWHGRYLPSFTGSGVMIDVDQTYDVKARIMWIGLNDENEDDDGEKEGETSNNITTASSE